MRQPHKPHSVSDSPPFPIVLVDWTTCYKSSLFIGLFTLN